MTSKRVGLNILPSKPKPALYGSSYPRRLAMNLMVGQSCLRVEGSLISISSTCSGPSNHGNGGTLSGVRSWQRFTKNLTARAVASVGCLCKMIVASDKYAFLFAGLTGTSGLETFSMEPIRCRYRCGKASKGSCSNVFPQCPTIVKSFLPVSEFKQVKQ